MTAIAAYERAIGIAHESGNLFWEQLVVADALQALAGNPKAALGMFDQMLNTWQGSPDAARAVQGIGGLIILFERIGQAAQAVTLHAALMHYLPSLRMLEELPAAIERAKTALGDAAFNEATQRGAVMESHEMTEFARTEIAHVLSTVG